MSAPQFLYGSKLFTSNCAFPKLYGAVGNGSHNDYEAFRAAANSLSGKGYGVVICQPKPYLVSGPDFQLPDGVTLEGNARMIGTGRDYTSPATGYGTVLLSDRAGVVIKPGNGSAIKNLIIDTATSLEIPGTTAIDFSEKEDVVLENLTINCADVGIADVCTNHKPQTFRISNVRVLNAYTTGLRLSNAVWGRVDELICMNLRAGFSGHSNGVELLSGSASIAFNHCLMQTLNRGIYAVSGAAGWWERMLDDVKWTDCTIDSSQNCAAYIYGLNDGCFTGLTVAAANGWGLYFDGTTNKVTVMGSNFGSVTKSAVYLDNTNHTDLKIIGVSFSACCPGGTYNVIDMAAGCSNFTIQGCRHKMSDPMAVPDGHPPYFVNVPVGASTHYDISGNVGTGVIDVVNDGGTGLDKRVTGNTK